LVVNTNNGGALAARRVHWTARGISAFVTAFWLLISIAEAIGEPEPWTWQSWMMAGLITSSTLGVIVAWWKEGTGGAIVIACAIAHSTFAAIVAGHNKLLAVLISGGPYLLIGILFLVSWRLSNHPATKRK
jgi:hypothetical protein